MLEVVPYKAAHAVEVIRNEPKQPGLVLDGQVQDWAKVKESRGPAVTGLWDGRIIACGGLEILWPGMAEAWCLFAKHTDKHRLAARMRFAEAAQGYLWEWAEQYQLVRIQAPLRADFPAGARFAKFLGFKYESTMPKYHPDGSTALMYSIILER